MYRTFVSLCTALLLCAPINAQPARYRFTANKMGSPFNLVIVAQDSSTAAGLAARAFALVDSLNQLFSDYDSTSELSLINRSAGAGTVHISPALNEIIGLSQVAWSASDRSFDITIGPLSLLWRRCRREHRFPGQQEVLSARKKVGFTRLHYNTHTQTISPEKGVRLDLGGIAKGYTAQKVVELLRSLGAPSALADAGGDIAMSEPPPGHHGWTVGVNVPEEADNLLPRNLQLSQRSVATSGDVYQFIEHNGKKFSHIIDPRTGYGITSQRNVTVIAKNGAEADWLATACSILPLNAARRLAMSRGAGLLISVMENGRIVTHRTPGFDHYWKR